MKTLYNTTIAITNIDKERYDMLIDFLEDNNITYNEDDFEEYQIDERTEEEKYDEWLWEQADIEHDKQMLGE